MYRLWKQIGCVQGNGSLSNWKIKANQLCRIGRVQEEEGWREGGCATGKATFIIKIAIYQRISIKEEKISRCSWITQLTNIKNAEESG